jgi:hypothetical protein
VLLSSPRFQVTSERVPPVPADALRAQARAPTDAVTTEPIDGD